MLLSEEQAAFVTRYRAAPVVLPRPKQTAPAVPTDIPTEVRPSRHISAQALDEVGIGNMQGQQRDVLDIVLAAHRNGIADLSGREIQARYRMTHPGKDIDTGTISARVNSLIAAALLERGAERLCSITGKTVGPVRAVAQQARLVR